MTSDAVPAGGLPDAERLYERLLGDLRRELPPGAAMIGIATGGAWLAERLHRDLDIEAPLGVLDISFYRDDFDHKGLHHHVKPSKIPFEVEGRPIVLVDDVLFTGRTVRAAMNELFDYGRPAKIELAVLADRGGRELPISARFVGAKVDVPTGKRLLLERGEGEKLNLRFADERQSGR
jgi:pyrimidine operon attenuation protein/uracil phosphoribosyltransferase